MSYDYNAAIAIAKAEDGKYAAAIAMSPPGSKAKPAISTLFGAYGSPDVALTTAEVRAVSILSAKGASSIRVAYLADKYGESRIRSHSLIATATGHTDEESLPQGMRYLYAKAREAAEARAAMGSADKEVK